MADSPAEELRAAAKLIRKRTEAVKAASHTDWGDRPWDVTACKVGCACIVYQGEYKPFSEPQVPLIQYVADAESEAHAAWIASMHPLVGLALAEWLDVKAANLERAEVAGHHYRDHDHGYALAVARAYLNGGGRD